MSGVGNMLKHAIDTLFGANIPNAHTIRLEEVDRIHQQQEDRLNKARIAVMDGRFRQRFEVVAHQEQ